MAQRPSSPGEGSIPLGQVSQNPPHCAATPIMPPFINQSRSAQFIPDPKPDPAYKRCLKYIYNKEERTICGRTGKNWLEMISYATMYLIFLATYTMLLLYGSLLIIRSHQGSPSATALSDFFFLTYGDDVGLTATPAGVGNDNFPLIWYRNGEANDYGKYVSALDDLFVKQRRKREAERSSNLGPCGKPPYGYGDMPCIVLRINKQMSWAAKPLSSNSTVMQAAPEEIQKWVKSNPQKYWLLCNGYHSYDKEHIGSIKYYPYPPGFDADTYPIDMNATSPLVAIQVSNFTLGVSLSIECKLWYESGFSTVEFMIYVSPMRFHRNNSVIRY